MPHAHSISVRAVCRALILAALVAPLLAARPRDATATPAVSVANIAQSGVSPGGVDMASGELILVMRPDLVLDGPLPVVFSRYYASMLTREGLASGHLGPNWLGNFDWHITIAGSSADVITSAGKDVQFVPSPVGGWSLVKPLDHAYALSGSGTLARFTDPVERRIYVFSGAPLTLTQIIDEHGNTLTLTYTGGMLSQVSDGLGRALSFGYAPASGLLSSVSDGERGVSYTYTGGTLTGFNDAAGHTWTYGYGDPGPVQGLLTGMSEPLGNTPLTNTYDALGRVVSQSDAAGGLATYAYGTPSGNSFTDPLGHTWMYQHDAQNRLISFTDPGSGVWSCAYDASGRASSMSRPLGDATSYSYDPVSGYLSAVGMADGSAIHWTYGSHAVGGGTLFDLATTQYPDLSGESFTRDAAGNPLTFTDRAGLHWLGTFNARGQVLTATNPAGGVAHFAYDTPGRLASMLDPIGNLTTMTYDALGRLLVVLEADTSSRTFSYDTLDHVTGTTDERGKSSSFSYDANGRLMSATDPLGHSVQYAYDALDRPTQLTDPLGQAMSYAYDPAGRLASFTDRTHRAMQYAYDLWGNLTGVTDPAAASWTCSYDADLRAVSAQDPLMHAVQLTPDVMDRVTHVADAVGTGFDYGYDVMGRLHTAQAPLGHSQTYGYDARGLLISLLDVGAESDWARTPLGEVSQFTDPNRNAWPSSYDVEGRLSGASDPLGRSQGYVYDSRSRLIHADLPAGSANLTFDHASRLLSAAYSDGTTLSFAYDDANRLTGASGASFAYDEAGRMVSSNGLAFTYDAEGRLASETYGPGKVVNYSYDTRGLLAQVTDWIGGASSFSYDAAGKLVGQTRPSNVTLTRTYDAADRLTSSIETRPPPQNDPISSIAITRDALGEPTGIQRSAPLLPAVQTPGTTNFSYDAASQTTGLTWDAMGRLLGDGSRSFQWDGASRLTHFVAGAESPTFTYDALGNVLTRTQGAAVQQYVWNYANGSPTLDVVMVAGAPARYFVHTPDGLLLHSIEAAGGARRFVHYDEDGNTLFLTDDAGTVAAAYAYSPTGAVTASGAGTDPAFTLGAADGAIQLGSSGLFSVPGGGIYDTKFAREISGGAVASGGDMVSARPPPNGIPINGIPIDGVPTPRGSLTSGRQDYADACSAWWIGPDSFERAGSGTSMHELAHSIGLDHGGRDPGPANDAFESGVHSVAGIAHSTDVVEWPPSGASHLRLKRHFPLTGMADFGTVKTDQNRLGSDGFGGGYSSSLDGGDEIFVDRYGRVKVQFFWDREGKKDDNSSCWIRVNDTNGGTRPQPRIDVLDFSWGIANAGSMAHGTGGGEGKARFHDIPSNLHSAAHLKLPWHCSGGVHLKEGSIIIRRAGASPPRAGPDAGAWGSVPCVWCPQGVSRWP